jgi:hypothetical protein
MYVCMYVSMYVCMYACIYVCMSSRTQHKITYTPFKLATAACLHVFIDIIVGLAAHAARVLDHSFSLRTFPGLCIDTSLPRPQMLTTARYGRCSVSVCYILIGVVVTPLLPVTKRGQTVWSKSPYNSSRLGVLTYQEAMFILYRLHII